MQRKLREITTSSYTITYEYGHAGRRLSKTVAGKRTEYVYNGIQLIGEYSIFGDSRRIARKFIYGWGVDEPSYIDTAIHNESIGRFSRK